jgi:hypothetical protein
MAISRGVYPRSRSPPGFLVTSIAACVSGSAAYITGISLAQRVLLSKIAQLQSPLGEAIRLV